MMVGLPLEILAQCYMFRAFKLLFTLCRRVWELCPRLFCVSVCRFYVKCGLGKTACTGGIPNPVPLLAEALKELKPSLERRRQMRAIFSLSCPHWRSLSSTAWTSVFHTHSACLGNVHIVLPKSNLLAHVEKGDWLRGSLALHVVFLRLRLRDWEGFEQDANILNWIFSL